MTQRVRFFSVFSKKTQPNGDGFFQRLRLFHLLVLWASLGIDPKAVLDELARREGKSGETRRISVMVHFCWDPKVCLVSKGYTHTHTPKFKIDNPKYIEITIFERRCFSKLETPSFSLAILYPRGSKANQHRVQYLA